MVTEATGISTDMHLDVQRLPNAVVDNACPNVSEVLLLAVGVSARCDQLEVVRVNALGDRYVRVDKRPQAKLFDPNEFRVLWSHRHGTGDCHVCVGTASEMPVSWASVFPRNATVLPY